MSAPGVDIGAVPIKTESSMSSKTDNSCSVSKVCSVCGDLALGYNFNAVSCESCKAFFRRNALKDKEFKCPFKEDCVMTPVTRRFCQRCRLRKCFAVGMRKEYIMSDEERMSKRQKIEQNRARKRGSQNVDALNFKSSRQSVGTAEWQTIDSPICAQDDTLSPQRSVDTLEPFPSPVTATSAGSIPSPDSPPESASIAVSDNVEMLAQLNNIVDLDRSCSGAQTLDPASPISSLGLAIQPTKIVRTTWTQTAPTQQSTPLLTSLISSPPSVREATTSPRSFDTSASVLYAETVSPWAACLPNATMSSSDHAGDTLQDVLRMNIMPNSIESILSEAIRLEYSTYTPPLAPFSASSQIRELNDAERAKLNELIVANKALNIPIDDFHHKIKISVICDVKIAHFRCDNLVQAESSKEMPPFCLVRATIKQNFRVDDEQAICNSRNQDKEPALLDIINLTAVAIRRLIKMTKKISAFKNMCQEDQIALLKGACMEMLILRGAMNYNSERDTWDVPSGADARMRNISVNVLKKARGNLYQEHQRFQRSFDPRCRNDENIMLILSAIALFTPDRLCVIHHDVVRLEQNSYYYLLRRYLECTFPGCEARSTFLKLIQKMSELHRLNEEHIRAYLDVNPSEVEPLLIEIFDLKSQ